MASKTGKQLATTSHLLVILLFSPSKPLQTLELNNMNEKKSDN